MNLFLLLFKTYNNYFFFADSACLSSSSERRLVLYWGREMPSHPLMMFDFLCCAHEAVPPTLSPSPIIYICSSFCAVILQLFPYFFSLLPLPIWGRKKNPPDTFNLFPHSIPTFLCRAPGAALPGEAAVKCSRDSTHSSRRKLLSRGRSQEGKFFVVCFEQAPLLHFMGPSVCFPLQQECVPQHHVAKRRQRPLFCVITSDITLCCWDGCTGKYQGCCAVKKVNFIDSCNGLCCKGP